MPVDLSLLPDFLRQQRWFSGKAAPIKTVTVLDHAKLEGAECEFTLALLEVQYELGAPERYLLPVVPSERGHIREALDRESCLRTLFQVMRDGREFASTAGRIRGEWLGGADSLKGLTDASEVRRLAVEQSNTSFVVGDRVIVKLIRKIEVGTNPEYAVGRFLARAGYRHTPRLLGALHLEGAMGGTLALAHQFVADATDGWKYTLEVFRRSKAPTPRFLGEMRELGARLGELHAAFATGTDDPAFAPEPLLAEDLQRWSASIAGEMGVTLADAARLHPELEQHRERLLEHARQLAHVPPAGLKIRVHGDLHLGQVLHTPRGWLIFDFEGEPGRPFAARREKTSALKDVAGMLRSFDYAQSTVELEGGPGEDRIGPARAAFLEGYRTATRGAAFLPEDEATFLRTLDAFELEKLLYEVRYELANRPDWVRIPIRALLRMEVQK